MTPTCRMGKKGTKHLSDLNTRKSYGADNPKGHQAAHSGQLSDHMHPNIKLMKGRFSLSFISFYANMNHLVYEGKAVDVLFLALNEAVVQSILLKKVAAHGLSGCTVHWMKIWGWMSRLRGSQ